MTTWGAFRDAVRADIHDNPANPRISDDLLFQYFRWAIYDYSLYNPQIKTAQWILTDPSVTPNMIPSGYPGLLTAQTAPGSTFVNLPDDVNSVSMVEAPPGRLLEPLRKREGFRYASVGPYTVARTLYPTQYWTQDGVLYLNQAYIGPIIITYTADHDIPPNSHAFDFALSYPDRDEPLLVLYVKAKNAESLRGRQAGLDRFKDKSVAGNTRVDNPMKPEAASLMQEYYDEIYRRYAPTGAITLVRPGRGRG